MISIMLVDDHQLVRDGFRALIERIGGVGIVGEADNGRTAISLIEKIVPDVLLVDIELPFLNDIELVRRITREQPRTRSVILTAHREAEYVMRALRAGAVGYLLKDSTIAEVEFAIRAVHRGDTYLTPKVSTHLILDALNRTANEEDDAESSLTDREREILQLVAEGLSTKEIALLLNISAKTVDTHRAHLMERLGIHKLAGLVRYAVRIGLVRDN